MNDDVQTMIKHAEQALHYAYAPYSHFAVAACICSEDNHLFTGVNVENGSYGLSICAETSAICQLIAAGHRHIKSMVILASDNRCCAPCGACRQRIHEFATPKTRIHLCNKDTLLKTMTIDALLPMAFCFKPLDGHTHD